MSNGTGVCLCLQLLGTGNEQFEGQGAPFENIHCNNPSPQNCGGFPETLWFTGEEVGILFYAYLPLVFVLVDNVHFQ